MKSCLPPGPPRTSTSARIPGSIAVSLVRPRVNCSQMPAPRAPFNYRRPHPGNVALDPGTSFESGIQMRTRKMLIGAAPSPQKCGCPVRAALPTDAGSPRCPLSFKAAEPALPRTRPPLCTPATARPPAGLGRPSSAPRTRAHNAQRPPNTVTGMKGWWAGGRRPSSVPRGTLDGPPRIRDVKSQSTCEGRRT